ncbi:hypothetical protein BN1263500050 [Stenotrophomonas indicatrix]|nr:hypothetical protein BN1263500050 [Stenotrophomonas indicatrix]
MGGPRRAGRQPELPRRSAAAPAGGTGGDQRGGTPRRQRGKQPGVEVQRHAAAGRGRAAGDPAGTTVPAVARQRRPDRHPAGHAHVGVPARWRTARRPVRFSARACGPGPAASNSNGNGNCNVKIKSGGWAVRFGGAVWACRTRRKPIHGGSMAPSMAPTVLQAHTAPPLTDRGASLLLVAVDLGRHDASTPCLHGRSTPCVDASEATGF